MLARDMLKLIWWVVIGHFCQQKSPKRFAFNASFYRVDGIRDLAAADLKCRSKFAN